MSSAARPSGGLHLLRTNAKFRALWLANIVSLLGDWLDLIAINNLVVELAREPGSTMSSSSALAATMIARFLPNFIVGPIAGNTADRYPRHTVMIWANIASTGFVLMFLLVLSPQGLPWLAVLMFLKMTAQAFFIPANQAAVPMVVDPEDLQSANVIMTTSWSLMLAVGATLGAVVVHWIGPMWALGIDAATFLVANLFIRNLALPVAETARGAGRGWHTFKEGLDYIRANPVLAPMLWIKPVLGIAGGGLLYPLMAERVWILPDYSPEKSFPLVMGLQYLGFGLGTLLGPIPLRRHGNADVPTMVRRLPWAFLVVGVFGVLFPIWGLTAGVILQTFSAMGRAVLWVYSTTLLQVLVPDRFRGRVFAVEFGLMTLGMAISVLISNLAIEHGMLPSPRELGVVLSALALVAMVPYFALARRAATLPTGHSPVASEPPE